VLGAPPNLPAGAVATYVCMYADTSFLPAPEGAPSLSNTPLPNTTLDPSIEAHKKHGVRAMVK